MMRRLAVLLLVAGVALAGCGGGDSSDDARDGSTTTEGGTNNTDGGSNGDDSPFSDLLTKSKEASYKVTYTSGDDDEVFSLVQDPPLFAYLTDDSATYVTADDKAITCSGSGSSATCTEVPGSGDSYRTGLSSGFGAAGALFLSAAGSSIPGLLDIETSDDEIAGRDGVCATIDGSTLGAIGQAIKGSYSVCVDKETGVLLRLQSDDGSGSSDNLTATKFEEPSAADFTPPVTPGTIPGQ